MNNINIDKNISPGDSITFRVTMEFYGFAETAEFDFIAPKACPQLNKLNNVFFEKGKPRDTKINNGTFNFTKYKKLEDIGGILGDSYRIKVYMENQKSANELNPGEIVILRSTNAKLTNLKNRECQVIKSNTNNDNPKIVHLKVKKIYQPNPASGVQEVTNSQLEEKNKTVKEQRIKITPPDVVFNGLVKKTSAQEVKKGDVEDIIIYAYKQFEGKNSANAKRKLMINDADVNENRPPERETVLIHRKGKSYARDFKLEDKKNILCYISIARYVYNGEKWVGDWVQQNKLGQAIWARAVPKEK